MEERFPIKIRRKRISHQLSDTQSLIALDQVSAIQQPPTVIRNRSIQDDTLTYFDYDAPTNFTKSKLHRLNRTEHKFNQTGADEQTTATQFYVKKQFGSTQQFHKHSQQLQPLDTVSSLARTIPNKKDLDLQVVHTNLDQGEIQLNTSSTLDISKRHDCYVKALDQLTQRLKSQKDLKELLKRIKIGLAESNHALNSGYSLQVSQLRQQLAYRDKAYQELVLDLNQFKAKHDVNRLLTQQMDIDQSRKVLASISELMEKTDWHLPSQESEKNLATPSQSDYVEFQLQQILDSYSDALKFRFKNVSMVGGTLQSQQRRAISLTDFSELLHSTTVEMLTTTVQKTGDCSKRFHQAQLRMMRNQETQTESIAEIVNKLHEQVRQLSGEVTKVTELKDNITVRLTTLKKDFDQVSWEGQVYRIKYETVSEQSIKEKQKLQSDVKQLIKSVQEEKSQSTNHYNDYLNSLMQKQQLEKVNTQLNQQIQKVIRQNEIVQQKLVEIAGPDMLQELIADCSTSETEEEIIRVSTGTHSRSQTKRKKVLQHVGCQYEGDPAKRIKSPVSGKGMQFQTKFQNLVSDQNSEQQTVRNPIKVTVAVTPGRKQDPNSISQKAGDEKSAILMPKSTSEPKKVTFDEKKTVKVHKRSPQQQSVDHNYEHLLQRPGQGSISTLHEQAELISAGSFTQLHEPKHIVVNQSEQDTKQSMAQNQSDPTKKQNQQSKAQHFSTPKKQKQEPKQPQTEKKRSKPDSFFQQTQTDDGMLIQLACELLLKELELSDNQEKNKDVLQKLRGLVERVLARCRQASAMVGGLVGIQYGVPRDYLGFTDLHRSGGDTQQSIHFQVQPKLSDSCDVRKSLMQLKRY